MAFIVCAKAASYFLHGNVHQDDTLRHHWHWSTLQLLDDALTRSHYLSHTPFFTPRRLQEDMTATNMKPQLPQGTIVCHPMPT